MNKTIALILVLIPSHAMAYKTSVGASLIARPAFVITTEKQVSDSEKEVVESTDSVEVIYL